MYIHLDARFISAGANTITSYKVFSMNIIRIAHKLVGSSTALTQLSWQVVGSLNDIHTQHLVAGTASLVSFRQNVGAILLSYI